MVPGSTLMYGSSLRIETLRPRALNRRPTLAAVMPLPSEEVTPPVSKTYFAMGRVLRGLFQCYRIRGPGTTGIRHTAGCGSVPGAPEGPREASLARPSTTSSPACALGCEHRVKEDGAWNSVMS